MEQNLLTGTAELINRKAKFRCSVPGQAPITVDYIPPHGDGEGYTSLQLLLLSLASCVATTVKFILAGSMGKSVSAIKAEASGIRRSEHPTCFETINVLLHIEADNLNDKEMERVIKAAKDSVCPVYAMLKNNTGIMIEYEIGKDA